MTKLFTFAIFCFTSVTLAAERPLLDGPNVWTGSAGGKSSLKIVEQNPLTVAVTVGGGSEGFPAVKLNLPAAEDWRGYTKLVCEVKLESDDPGPRDGGKEFAICLYDWGHRHDYLNGRSFVQQLFARMKVNAGDWQTATIDLRPTVRGQVAMLDIYLYDTPYNYPHDYKVSFRNMRLVGPDAEKAVFDGQSYPRQSLKGDAGKIVGTIQTEDGMKLALGTNGGVIGLQLGKQSLGNGSKQISGILLRDAKTNSPPVMAGGAIVQKENTFAQTAELPGKALKLQATYREEKERIIIDGYVESTNAEDRAVTVYIALPLSAGDWTGHQSLSRATKPFEEMQKLPQLEDGFCAEPLAVLADKTNDRGLALILDQKYPVVYRFIVNPREKLLYAAFDFALLNQDNHNGNSQRKAGFHLELVRTDPAWGYRSGLEKLYSIHAEHYTDRVGYGGGWECSRTRNKFSDEQNLVGAYRFDWSAAEIDQTRWEWNKKNGIKNLIYIEPDFLQFSMGDFDKPTVAETALRMKKLAENDETEWEKFLPLHYSKAFNCNPHSKAASQRPFLEKLITSIDASGMYDKSGRPILGLGNRPGWIGNSGFGAMIPANLAPGIPGGRGATILKHCLGELYDEFVENGWSRPDGFGLDCFMDVPDDYRRENFRYMTIPLSFDTETGQPMVPRGFGSIEWLKELHAKYADRQGLIMANAFGPMIFAAPYLDIFGIENTQVLHPDQTRVIAGPKRPVTFLTYNPPAQEVLDYHLIWGIYPGRNVDPAILATMTPVLDQLYQASWQPVTGATFQSDGVFVERFGKKTDKHVYLGLYNGEREGVTVKLTLDSKVLGPRKQAKIIYNGSEVVPIKNGELILPLEGKQTRIVQIE